MRALWSIVLKYWKPAAVTAAGLASLVFLKNDAYADVTQELIALFGLMMAGVLPTMVLTASALRAGNLSIMKLRAYRNALVTQLKVWIGLFLVSLMASLLVIIGKMVGWSLLLTVPLGFLGLGSPTYDAIRVLNALVSACLVLVVLRGFAVGKGIMSLLTLSVEIALSEAKIRDEERHRAGDDAIGRIEGRSGYGDYVELKH